MPSNESLGAAESTDLGVLLASRVDEQVLRLVVAKVEHKGACQIGKQGILLKLIGHDRHVALAIASNTQALLGVADGVPDGHLAS